MLFQSSLALSPCLLLLARWSGEETRGGDHRRSPADSSLPPHRPRVISKMRQCVAASARMLPSSDDVVWFTTYENTPSSFPQGPAGLSSWRADERPCLLLARKIPLSSPCPSRPQNTEDGCRHFQHRNGTREVFVGGLLGDLQPRGCEHSAVSMSTARESSPELQSGTTVLPRGLLSRVIRASEGHLEPPCSREAQPCPKVLTVW